MRAKQRENWKEILNAKNVFLFTNLIISNYVQLFSILIFESVIIWKEKHLGTAETVQVSDTDSIKCNGNVFRGY